MAIQKGGIMKKNDPNYIVKVEKAIAEKYGEEAIQNPKRYWTDEKEKQYVKQLKDLYKVMPFDNSIVWVKLPLSTLHKISIYLKSSGGEPISNVQMQSGKLILKGIKMQNFFGVKKSHKTWGHGILRDTILIEL